MSAACRGRRGVEIDVTGLGFYFLLFFLKGASCYCEMQGNIKDIADMKRRYIWDMNDENHHLNGCIFVT